VNSLHVGPTRVFLHAGWTNVSGVLKHCDLHTSEDICESMILYGIYTGDNLCAVLEVGAYGYCETHKACIKSTPAHVSIVFDTLNYDSFFHLYPFFLPILSIR